jgi:hypothetical protein
MDKSNKISTGILWGLMIVSIIFFVMMLVNLGDELNLSDKGKQLINLNLNWTYILFAITACLTIGFAFAGIVTDLKKAKGALIALLGAAALLLVSYFIASDAIPEFFGANKFIADGTLTATVSKWVGTGLYMTYLLFVLAIGSIMLFGAARVFKR